MSDVDQVVANNEAATEVEVTLDTNVPEKKPFFQQTPSIQSMGQTALYNAGVMVLTSAAVAGTSKVLEVGWNGLKKLGSSAGSKIKQFKEAKKAKKAAKKLAKANDEAQETPEEAAPEEEKTE